jgi:hypothetical protein
VDRHRRQRHRHLGHQQLQPELRPSPG